MGKLERKLSSSQMIILGFAAVILLGALLLMLERLHRFWIVC